MTAFPLCGKQQQLQKQNGTREGKVQLKNWSKSLPEISSKSLANSGKDSLLIVQCNPKEPTVVQGYLWFFIQRLLSLGMDYRRIILLLQGSKALKICVTLRRVKVKYAEVIKGEQAGFIACRENNWSYILPMTNNWESNWEPSRNQCCYLSIIDFRQTS